MVLVGFLNYQSQDVKSDCRRQSDGSKGNPHWSLPFRTQVRNARFIPRFPRMELGRCLRAEYALERAMPARLVNNLLKQFEQGNGEPEAMTRQLC